MSIVSAEVQTERDVRARMETEHKEREGRLQAMNAVSTLPSSLWILILSRGG